VESATPAAQALYETGRSWQGPEKDHYCSLLVNCWASSGPLEPEQRLSPTNTLQPDKNQSKDKKTPQKEKAKTFNR
jgi:hypothetical protein